MDGWWAVSYVVLWLLVVALGVIVVALARQIGTLHLRLGPRGALEIDSEGPPLGEAPPGFDLADLQGRPVTVGGPGPGRLLLFVTPHCRLCEEVLPGLGAAARGGLLEPLVLTDLDEDEARSQFGGRLLGAPLIPAGALVRTYDVPGTPYVVVLDETGVVRAKGTVNNLEQLEGLIDTARRRVREASA